jgi:hypothetical protein
MLEAGGHAEKMWIAPSYAAVLRQVVRPEPA